MRAKPQSRQGVYSLLLPTEGSPLRLGELIKQKSPSKFLLKG